MKSRNQKFIIRDTRDIKYVSGEVGIDSISSVVWIGTEAFFETFLFLCAFGPALVALELTSALPQLGSK